MRILPLTLLLGVLASCTLGENGESAPGPRMIVEAVIDEQIIPDHAAFAEAAGRQKNAVDTLCEAPGTAALETAREEFADLVGTWSRIEWLSFGPARENNRREALFFWPDSRGRGLRQAQELAASDDPSQFEGGAFEAKSVAVKGLLALEHVLFGEGAKTLTTEGAPRCAYARAIAAAIASNARELETAWSGADGYRAVLLEAGPDNRAYRNHREALQVLLTAASEQMQIVRDLKLAPILRERNGEPTPILPPFSGSGLALDAITANIDSASTVFLDHATRLLPQESAYRRDSLAFEINTIKRVLDEFNGASPEALAAFGGMRDRLAYVIIPMQSAHDLMSQTYPAALGLIMGFNSLDGD